MDEWDQLRIDFVFWQPYWQPINGPRSEALWYEAERRQVRVHADTVAELRQKMAEVEALHGWNNR